MDTATTKEAILVLAGVATITGTTIGLLRFLRRKRDPVELLLCDRRGYPRSDVWLQVGDCRCNPDEHGRVQVSPKYLGSTIMVFAVSSGRLVLTTKLEKAGNESTVKIIVP